MTLGRAGGDGCRAGTHRDMRRSGRSGSEYAGLGGRTRRRTCALVPAFACVTVRLREEALRVRRRLVCYPVFLPCVVCGQNRGPAIVESR